MKRNYENEMVKNKKNNKKKIKKIASNNMLELSI